MLKYDVGCGSYSNMHVYSQPAGGCIKHMLLPPWVLGIQIQLPIHLPLHVHTQLDSHTQLVDIAGGYPHTAGYPTQLVAICIQLEGYLHTA